MKTTLLFFVLLSVTSSVCGQQQNIWIGGTPGHVSDWNCDNNWNTHRVPDAFADVVIPRNVNPPENYPVIKSTGIAVNSLRILCGARVTIAETGSLTIYNPDYCDDVSRILVLGKLELPGRTQVLQETVLLSSF